jgi:hypothetical protein
MKTGTAIYGSIIMHIIINIDNTIADLKPIANNDIPADVPADVYFRFMKNLMFRIKPYSGAVKTLQYISEYMDIIYTTARPTEASFVTVRWLEINEFPSGQILFLPPNQRLFPDAAGIIDDDPRVARLYRGQENKVYVKTQPYNTQTPGNRFYSWDKLLNALTQANKDNS